MKRRQSIRILGWSIPLTGISLVSGIGCNTSENPLAANSQLFSSEQWSLLHRIVDIIIPKTDTPSATEVGVPKRIEELLINNHLAKTRQQFINGLQFIENQCLTRYQKNSEQCKINEIAEILNLIIQNNQTGTSLDIHPFYPLLKGLTVSAFFTSKEMNNYFNIKKQEYKF